VRRLATGAHLLPQRRIGGLRSGKGDAVNTAFDYFLASASERLHLFDADIKTFDVDWIERADAALDRGFAVVRHFYPRAPTDGMITAMVVRPALAMRWPETSLARVRQPLSGELAFTREAAAVLAAAPMVRWQSDWGIDTVLTVMAARLGLANHENLISRGKDHQLYGSLDDLETMFWECLHALQLVWNSQVQPRPSEEQTPGAGAEGEAAVTKLVAFDVAASRKIMQRPLGRHASELLRTHFSTEVGAAITSGDAAYLTTAPWLASLAALIKHAKFDDESWRTLGFRLWVARVLHYTERVVPRGFQQAMEYIDDMVRQAMFHPFN